MKKILFFAASQKGYEVLRYMIKNHIGSVGAVVSFNEIEVQKNWCEDIERLCEKQKVPFYLWEEVKKTLSELIIDHSITSAICISWRYLIPIQINDYLEDNLIVFHDSLLPRYRGFAPVVTAMLHGDKTIGATAIFAENEVDAGDVICQKSFSITSEDYICDVINRMTEIYVEMAEYVVLSLNNNTIESIKQDEGAATYSIWRDEDDYWINWNWSAETISRHVHALGYPYKGAKTSVEGQVIRITKCVVVEDLEFEIRMPGKVWKIIDNQPIVVCEKGMIKVEEAFNENGDYIQFSKLRSRFGS